MRGSEADTLDTVDGGHVVDQQGQVGQEAGQPVVDQHEEHHRQEAGHRRPHSSYNRVAPERRTDRALFEVGDGGRQRTGSQLEAEILRLWQDFVRGRRSNLITQQIEQTSL